VWWSCLLVRPQQPVRFAPGLQMKLTPSTARISPRFLSLNNFVSPRVSIMGRTQPGLGTRPRGLYSRKRESNGKSPPGTSPRAECGNACKQGSRLNLLTVGHCLASNCQGYAEHIIALVQTPVQNGRFGRRSGTLFSSGARFRSIHDGGILPRGACAVDARAASRKHAPGIS